MKELKSETRNDNVDKIFRQRVRILLIYRKMTPSVRMCGHTQLEYLSEQCEIEYRACKEMKITTTDMVWADIVFLGRLDSWYERRLAEILHKAGKYMVYIMDDDLLEIPQSISSAAYFNQADIQNNIKCMIEMSDAICSPSSVLLGKYATGGKKAVLIEEPAIDPVVYRNRSAKPIKIGFAGSVDRKLDVERMLMNVLIQIKRKYGDSVQFEFFGAIPSEAGTIGAKCIPYCNQYDEYKNILNRLEWDIGVAPMPDTPFHACKHYNKYIEYASAGIAGVFSNVPPYSQLKIMNAPVMLCENTEKDWFDTICFLIDQKDLRERYRFMANSYVRKQMNVQKTAEDLKIEKLIEELNDWPIRTASHKGDLLWLLKTIGCVKRMTNMLKRSIRRIQLNNCNRKMID